MSPTTNPAQSTALLTDHYELTMLQAALASGTAHRRSVFELFGRRLPEGRRYGVVAGVGRALDAIEDFRFDDRVLAALDGVVDQPTLDHLAAYSFTGDVWGYAEGDAYFAHSPLVVVEATFAEAVVLETLLLSIYNHDSAVASAASRMTSAAGDRPCIEMGSRRTHEEAAVASARAAYVAGFASSSNLAARERYGVPTAGTSAHSFTLLHDSEADAFRAQVESLGPGTTLLVDTYDTLAGVRTAVEVAGPELGAVRLDSGDLKALAHEVRDLLDSLGATETRIVVTSDLDEHAIASLSDAPVDGYGVGTELVTGSGHPTSGFVYKLVAREGPSGELETVAKKSVDKVSVGGRKWALRRRTPQGVAEAEVVGIGEPPTDDGDDRPLLVPLVRDGQVVGREPLEAARDRHAMARAELPPDAQKLSKGDPVIPTVFEGETLMALLTCDFFSEALERGTSMTVVLPQPTEEQIGVAEVSVDGPPPVLYLLHGLSDDHSAWLRFTSIERYAAARGLAVVMPAVDRSFYANEAHGHAYWDYVSDELPGVVAQFLRVSQDPAETYVAGLSMGGYGALKHAFTHPERYAAVASLSGVVDIRQLGERLDRAEIVDRVFDGAFGPEDDLFELLAGIDPVTAPRVYLGCGTEEDRLMPPNARLAAVARARGLDVTTDFRPGVHEWGLWDAQIQDVLDWMTGRSADGLI